jgi:hypothetical protein
MRRRKLFRTRWRRCEQVHPGELDDSNTTLTSMKSNLQAQKRPLQERSETPLKKRPSFSATIGAKAVRSVMCQWICLGFGVGEEAAL